MKLIASSFAAFLLTATSSIAATFTVTTDRPYFFNYSSLDQMNINLDIQDGDSRRLFTSDSTYVTSNAARGNVDSRQTRSVEFTVTNGIETFTQSANVDFRYTSAVDDNGPPGCLCYFGSAFLRDDLVFSFLEGTLTLNRSSLGSAGGHSPYKVGGGSSFATPTDTDFQRINASYSANVTTVPLPAALPMLAFGLLGLGGLHLKRRA